MTGERIIPLPSPGALAGVSRNGKCAKRNRAKDHDSSACVLELLHLVLLLITFAKRMALRAKRGRMPAAFRNRTVRL
jgi:hypothetical protein